MRANTVTVCGRWLLILLFLVAIGLPGLTMLLTPTRDWSEREKRKLAEPPALPRSTAELPRFFAGVDAYLNDHFGFRGLLVSRYQREMAKRFNRSGVPDKVLIGLDGWLFYTAFQLLEDFRGETPLSASQLDQWLLEQAGKEEWLRRRGIRYLLAAAPEKQSIYPEKLMANALAIKGTGRFEQLEQRLGGRLPAYMVDLHTPLRRARGGKSLYYKYDTHWNALGAYLAFGELFQRIGALFPDQAFTTEFAFGPDVTSYGGNRGIGGDLALILQRHLDFLTARGFLPDTLGPDRTGLGGNSGLGGDLALILQQGRELTETYPQLQRFERCAQPLPFPAGLSNLPNEKDRPSFAWGCPTRGLTAVVFRDSFFVPLERLFAENFREVVFLWKDYSQANMEEILTTFKPDLVLEIKVERHLFDSVAPRSEE